MQYNNFHSIFRLRNSGSDHAVQRRKSSWLKNADTTSTQRLSISTTTMTIFITVQILHFLAYQTRLGFYSGANIFFITHIGSRRYGTTIIGEILIFTISVIWHIGQFKTRRKYPKLYSDANRTEAWQFQNGTNSFQKTGWWKFTERTYYFSSVANATVDMEQCCFSNKMVGKKSKIVCEV